MYWRFLNDATTRPTIHLLLCSSKYLMSWTSVRQTVEGICGGLILAHKHWECGTGYG